MRFSNSNVQPTSFDCNGCVIGQRTQSDWIADRAAGAFKGVHLSQVHQQSYQVPNKTVKCTNFLSVVNILAWLVHFLLWQATKPSGDKCTP